MADDAIRREIERLRAELARHDQLYCRRAPADLSDTVEPKLARARRPGITVLDEAARRAQLNEGGENDAR